jgi:glyoxylase-like metal-dependent hydrolase (beta-lactamase superfamily II)
MTGPWTEIGDRVFVRRYRYLDQDIVAVLGRDAALGDAALVVDTRTTLVQAREILDDLHALGSPRVAVVVNTHGHYDHAFGNAAFRPAVIWGHERCATMIRVTGEAQRTKVRADPRVAADLDEVALDPPDRTFADQVTLELAGRPIELAYLGRGHTDNDIVLRVPDADVVCAGDLVENGAPPYFGDGFPIDWPATVGAMLDLTSERTVVVPGHGDPAGRPFVERSLADLEAIAALARRVVGGELTLADAAAAGPYPPPAALEPLERALAQLRGELDPPSAPVSR